MAQPVLLKNSRVVGLKQALKAVKNGTVAKVFIASDADEAAAELKKVCAEKDLPVDTSFTLKELGRIAQISVGAAAIAVLKDKQLA